MSAFTELSAQTEKSFDSSFGSWINTGWLALMNAGFQSAVEHGDVDAIKSCIEDAGFHGDWSGDTLVQVAKNKGGLHFAQAYYSEQFGAWRCETCE